MQPDVHVVDVPLPAELQPGVIVHSRTPPLVLLHPEVPQPERDWLLAKVRQLLAQPG